MNKLLTEIAQEAEKPRTTRRTWNLLKRFWASSEEIPDALLHWTMDRVEALEARMQREHGWAR